MADAFLAYRDMEMSDDAKLDWAVEHVVSPMPTEPPEYPPGLCFSVREPEFAKLGVDPAPDRRPQPGDRVPFAASCVVTSVEQSIGDCRIEIEIESLALGGGKPAALGEIETDGDAIYAPKPCLCLCSEQCERLDLDGDCETGDRLDLVGTARVEGWSDSRFGGKCLELQIVEMAVSEE